MTLNTPVSRRVTRASLLVTVIVILTVVSTRLRADIEATGTCGGASITLPFTDVPASNIFFCAIAEAYFSGLTNGTSATTYSPSANVPREQMAAFITRTLDQSLRRGSRRAALNQWWTPKDRGVGYSLVGNNGSVLLACDGADIWVANVNRETVTRVRASDGRLLETWTGAINAWGVVAIPNAIYISGNTNPGRLYRIDPDQPPGLVSTREATLGAFPLGITFDGLYIWTANFGGSISRVHRVATEFATFTSGFSNPVGILYDGDFLWVTDVGDDRLKRVNPATGAVVQTIAVGADPQFAIFDGANIWVPNTTSDSVSVVRAVGSLRGTVLATLTGNGLNGPYAAAFDGERILVTNSDGDSVSLWKAADLTPLGSMSLEGANTPRGACSDGLNFWIALFDTPVVARF